MFWNMAARWQGEAGSLPGTVTMDCFSQPIEELAARARELVDQLDEISVPHAQLRTSLGNPDIAAVL